MSLSLYLSKNVLPQVLGQPKVGFKYIVGERQVWKSQESINSIVLLQLLHCLCCRTGRLKIFNWRISWNVLSHTSHRYEIHYKMQEDDIQLVLLLSPPNPKRNIWLMLSVFNDDFLKFSSGNNLFYTQQDHYIHFPLVVTVCGSKIWFSGILFVGPLKFYDNTWRHPLS